MYGAWKTSKRWYGGKKKVNIIGKECLSYFQQVLGMKLNIVEATIDDDKANSCFRSENFISFFHKQKCDEKIENHGIAVSRQK